MLDHFQHTLIQGHNFAGSYAILFFTASGFTSITSHIHSCCFCLFSASLFIMELFLHSCPVACWLPTSLDSSSFSVLYIYKCIYVYIYIFLSFHAVHGVLKARILKWVAIPYSSGPHFVRTLHHDPSALGCLTLHVS